MRNTHINLSLTSLVLIALLVVSSTSTQAVFSKLRAFDISSNEITDDSSTQFDEKRAAEVAIAYVSTMRGYDPQNLQVIRFHDFKINVLNQGFIGVTLLDIKDKETFQIAVEDVGYQAISYNDLLVLEQRQLDAVYGKLQPGLADKLQTIKESDTLPVMILVASDPSLSLNERITKAKLIVDAKYPEPNPDDPIEEAALIALIDQRQQEYMQLVTADVGTIIQPVVDDLTKRGIKFEVPSDIPVVFASMSKLDILDIAKLDRVGTIYEADLPGTTGMQSAGPAARAFVSNPNGGRGGAGRIAIVEHKSVDMTTATRCANNCFTAGGLNRGNGIPEDVHPTLVASVAASTDATYRGIAQNAVIISAPFTTPLGSPSFSDWSSALSWALNPNTSGGNGGNANVINTSYGLCDVFNLYSAMDYIYDYHAKQSQRLFVAAAGNNPSGDAPCDLVNNNFFVVGPSKAWNVLTVGNFQDLNDSLPIAESDWTNDAMYSDSRYLDPPTGDRAKPEIVAPGTSVQAVADDGLVATRTGTSLSAPIVSGAGALLFSQNANLISRPPAARAILMATATHDVEIPRGSGYTANHDGRDGNGGININAALRVAGTRATYGGSACGAAYGCWWHDDFIAAPGSSTRYYYFSGKAGERVRAAIAWEADASCTYTSPPSQCNTTLRTNYDLILEDSAGNLVYDGVSASWDNNYELISPNTDIVLPTTTNYRLRVTGTTTGSNDRPYLSVALFRLPQEDSSYAKMYVRARYDDRNTTKIIYGPATNNWSQINDNKAYGASYRKTTSAGDTATLSVYAQSNIVYEYTALANTTISTTVYIDNMSIPKPFPILPTTTFNRYRVRVIWPVSAGTHTVKIVAGPGTTTIDSILADVPAVNMPYPSAYGFKVDDLNGILEYAGDYAQGNGWTHANVNQYSQLHNLSVSKTQSVGNSISMTFQTVNSGTLYYGYLRESNGGYAAVYLDGAFVATTDQYASSSLIGEQPIVISSGLHTITIVATNSHNPSSSGYSVSVDYFRFLRSGP